MATENNKQRRKDVLNAIKLYLETQPTGLVHTNDKKPPATPNEYRGKYLKYVDPIRNKTVMRGVFIIYDGPAQSFEKTNRRTPLEMSFKVLFMWEVEDSDTYNSSEDFSDMLDDFYNYIEQNPHLGFSDVAMQPPERIQKASMGAIDGFYFHTAIYGLKGILINR